MDNDVSGWYPHGTCACSADPGHNEWGVNLVESYMVDSVVIFNRRDCCQERLVGAKVSVHLFSSYVLQLVREWYLLGGVASLICLQLPLVNK